MANPFAVQPHQQQLLELVREFVARVVAPVAAELDRRQDPEQCFSWQIVEEASRVGIRTLTLGEEYGGAGADSLTTAMVIEELAKGDLGVAVIFAQTLKIAQTLQRACTPEQAARFIPPYAADPRGLLAIAITEPDTSSNYIIPYDSPQAPYRTTAVRRNGVWTLNGMKHFISNGNRAMLYLVFAQTDPGKSLVEGSTCFLVPRDTPGFSIGRVHDKMGERLVNNAELIFRDCRLGDDHVLGEVGGGFDILVQFFPASNAYAAASVLGVAGAAYERTLRWARERVQGGRRLIDHDTTAQDLAEMRMLLDAARAYTYQAAYTADHREYWDPTLGALPKVFASRVAWQVVTKALELHGGYGYMREMGVEKLVRDAAAFLHSDGANRSLLLKGARFIRRAAA
ncbi:MAG: acyl-CoA dehydrogenase family protein [Armatimonadota bacterium]|nr:acyl-CoA dehydrogenase family protein [Armatimonadota bacterium]MDR7426183.1 acyl-CoA dehydrogenase family protein [Armatimonadota bacterium]MDR7464052.1 acyl-CoA dehydrogenase family protein [Armatimonadota bacterium]MDR7469040.1 acyl-CoA dehydrogenase family protein [Armatimonadota bacterium]MDR7475617.1 acyl-CoA dehydrogenase family protein [Armatimonadota bacterium]